MMYRRPSQLCLLECAGLDFLLFAVSQPPSYATTQLTLHSIRKRWCMDNNISSAFLKVFSNKRARHPTQLYLSILHVHQFRYHVPYRNRYKWATQIAALTCVHQLLPFPKVSPSHRVKVKKPSQVMHCTTFNDYFVFAAILLICVLLMMCIQRIRRMVRPLSCLWGMVLVC